MRRTALRLVDDGLAGFYADYSAAEQATMAIASVGNFLHKQHGVKNIAAFNLSLRKLNDALASDEHYQPAEFAARLRDLRLTLAP